eukprot:3592697-Rhodomonas_salina.5
MEELLATSLHSSFPPALTQGQVPLLALKHLGAEGVGNPVGGKEQSSHSLHGMCGFRFRTAAFSGLVFRPSETSPSVFHYKNRCMDSVTDQTFFVQYGYVIHSGIVTACAVEGITTT